jgi:hypothetical protein
VVAYMEAIANLSNVCFEAEISHHALRRRAVSAQERLIWLAASIRSVRWSSSALVKEVKDVALMLPEEKLGAAPREAMCAVRPQ